MNYLENHLINNIGNLCGDWILQNSSYEEKLCRCLGFNKTSTRYWDATWNNEFIELKKGKSIWLDLVRYSEQVLNLNDESKNDVKTLFFIPCSDKSSIEKVICVSKQALIEYLKLDKIMALSLLMIKNHLPHSFNAQAQLTVNAIEEIADFVVSRFNPQNFIPKKSFIINKSENNNSNILQYKFNNGDSVFIKDAYDKLFEPIACLSKQLIKEIRKWYNGELIYNINNKRYIEDPDNFWTIDIQPRNQKYKVIVYGKPYNYKSHILDFKLNFRVYTEFFISNDMELQEGLRIIKEAGRLKGII